MAEPDRDRQRVIALSVDVFITIVMVSVFIWLAFGIVAPFVSVLIWAAVLAVALYPVFEWLKGRMGGGGRASSLIAVLGLVLILGPTVMVVTALIESVGDLAERLSEGRLHVPPPPETLKDIPIVGARAFAVWESASENLLAFSRQYSETLTSWSTSLLGIGGGLLIGVLQFALSVVFAAVLMAWGGELSELTRRLAHRMTARGRTMVDMAGRTVRNVSRGILGVAVIQGGAGAIGVIVAGLPFSGFLAVAIVVASIVQVPPLAILPIIGLAWATEPTLFSIIFTIYMLIVMFIDNVLKPILMARGLSTPMVVILIGVIGGTLSMGILGLFIGPVILALFHDMLQTWMAYDADPVEGDDEAEPGGST